MGRENGDRRSARDCAALLLAAILALGAVCSCSRDRVVDYANYEQIPNTAASATFRALAMSNPVTRKRLFYGNYGGPGNSGGPPVDQMDEIFRRHDIVYYNSRTKRIMLVADAELMEGLNSLDDSRLSAEALAYRERVVRFFSSPLCHWIGKPWSTFYTCREPEGSYFPSPEVVRRFFDRDHPGLPEKSARLAVRMTR